MPNVEYRKMLSGSRFSIARLLAANAALNAVGIVLALVLNVVLARSLAPADLGTYAEALAWHIVMATAGTGGADRLALREMGHHRNEQSIGTLTALVSYVRWRTFGISTSLGMVSFIGWCVAGALGSDGWLPIALGCLAAPLTSHLILNAGLLNGIGRNRAAQLPDQVCRPGLAIVLLLLAALLLPRLGGGAAISIYLVATLLSLALSYLLVRRSLPLPTPLSAAIGSSSFARDWKQASTVLMLVVIVHALSARLDVILLAAMGSSADVGLYHIAARLALLSTLLPNLLNVIIGPRAAQYVSTQRISDLQSEVTDIVRTIALVMAPWFALLLAYPEQVLSLLFGDAYVDAAPILRVLIVAHLINVVTGPAGTLLNVFRAERALLRGVSIGLVAMVLLSLALIPTYGAFGASLSAAAGLVSLNAYCVWYLIRTIGINPTILRRRP